MSQSRNPNYPYSVERLVPLSKTWDFDSDVDRLREDDDEPYWARACRRVQDAMRVSASFSYGFSVFTSSPLNG